MTKKQTGIRMTDEDYRKLRVWAAEADTTVGDIVAQLVRLVETQAEGRRRELLKIDPAAAGEPTLSLARMTQGQFQELLAAYREQAGMSRTV